MPYKRFKPEDIFQCKQCGDCCRGYGGTFVSDKDIKAIAGYIETDPENFISNYCQLSGNKPVLAQGPNGYCVFWDKLCRIHPVKPRMCKAWPFIESVLVEIKNWDIMAAACPGIRTDFPDDIILACVKEALSRMDRSE